MTSQGYLISKDIDSIIAYYVVKSPKLRLNKYFIIFQSLPSFCNALLQAFMTKQTRKLGYSPFKKVSGGIITQNKKKLMEGREICMLHTKPGTRKKYYLLLLLCGYKVVIKNSTKEIKTYQRKKGFICNDTTHFGNNPIPKCRIKREKIDFWDNWKTTDTTAECGCETFIQIKPMYGSKSDGISHVIGDLYASKVTTLPINFNK